MVQVINCFQSNKCYKDLGDIIKPIRYAHYLWSSMDQLRLWRYFFASLLQET